MTAKGEPENTKRVRETVVSFKNGEPSSIEVFTEYSVHVPEWGPEFEATDHLYRRYGETEVEHIIDALYTLVYQSGGHEWDSVRDELQEDGFVTVEARGGVGTAKVYEEDIEWEMVEHEGEHTGGMNAKWFFDVEGGEASVSEVEKVKIGFASDDAMPIEVLRTLPAAVHAARNVPGVDVVDPSGDVVMGYIHEGAEADWD